MSEIDILIDAVKASTNERVAEVLDLYRREGTSSGLSMAEVHVWLEEASTRLSAPLVVRSSKLVCKGSVPGGKTQTTVELMVVKNGHLYEFTGLAVMRGDRIINWVWEDADTCERVVDYVVTDFLDAAADGLLS